MFMKYLDTSCCGVVLAGEALSVNMQVVQLHIVLMYGLTPPSSLSQFVFLKGTVCILTFDTRVNIMSSYLCFVVLTSLTHRYLNVSEF